MNTVTPSASSSNRDSAVLSRTSEGMLQFHRRLHRAAFLAGAELGRSVEPLVGARHRVGLVVVDRIGLDVQQVIAAVAVPMKFVDLARLARALDDELE